MLNLTAMMYILDVLCDGLNSGFINLLIISHSVHFINRNKQKTSIDFSKNITVWSDKWLAVM